MRAFAGSVAAVALTTGVVFALRPIAPTLSLGVLYTLPVLAAALLFGIGPAIAVAVASMLAFNFFFLAPVHTLTLADARNWTALAVYLVTAVVASELAARLRREAAASARREREAALLSDVAAELLRVRAPETLMADVRARADRLLDGADPVNRARFEAALEALLAVAAERGRLEQEVHEAETLRRSDAIKTTILQTVSHDFRTPLATMTAAVGGLASGDLTLSESDRAELLDTVRLELARLTRLVENLLDLSRLQAGAAEPHQELWSAEDIVAGTVAEAAEPERVETDVAEGLPAVRVDAVQLQRALANLVDNALKFSPAGTIVEVIAREEGESVSLEVLDRGPGIGPAGAANLVRPFERGGAGGGGAGLGLAIAHGFAVVNGVDLRLELRDGGGTRAQLRLPAHPVPAQVPA